ncbi:MAG: PAS domain-containing protein [Alphaproteobacteria bacterium]|nr:PAS domain-containing protein [Alphaproteobacteria bacterium]
MHPTDGAGVNDLLAAVSEPRLQRFLAYLEEKRAGRAFAARGDIDPLDFAYILGDVVLLDVLREPLRFRYRVVGTALAGWRGYDLQGKLVDDHPDPEYRDFVLARYRETVELRRPTGGVYDLFLDGKQRSYQCVRVPLSTDGTTVDMIIAAFVLAR